MSRHIHLCMSVRGALYKHDKELRQQLGGCISFKGRTLHTAKEIRDALEWELYHGHEVIPVGGDNECVGFDYKTGCPGHEDIPTPAPKAAGNSAESSVNPTGRGE